MVFMKMSTVKFAISIFILFLLTFLRQEIKGIYFLDVWTQEPASPSPLTDSSTRFSTTWPNTEKTIVESLQSHMILTMSHWSSGLPVCFPPQGTQVQIPWGDLCETGILLLALSRYIGDPDVIYNDSDLSKIPNRLCLVWIHTSDFMWQHIAIP